MHETQTKTPVLIGLWSVKSVKIILNSLTLFSRSICLYFRVMKFKSAISDSVCRASIKRLMYLFTRVPGVLYTILLEKEERFLSFSEAVLNALLCNMDEERRTDFISTEILHCCSYCFKLTERMGNTLSKQLQMTEFLSLCECHHFKIPYLKSWYSNQRENSHFIPRF